MKQSKLTLGSLFDGSGGFPLGGLISGITPLWASEIEPFPIRVTTKRIPFMKHYGDISAMDGGEIEPVDIITFGSPCQDMSIAGRRDGLDGSRSSLFYQAIRIIKEMREKTNGEKPRWICWENVPGAFSSNKGEDFKAVLEAVIGIVQPDTPVPMPEKARWPYADLYMGDGWSVAYRTLDAQHWGVPQRRKRIYLVADLRGQCAGKILFECESLRGDSSEGRTPWQAIAGNAADCAGTADRAAGFCTEHSAKAGGVGFQEEVAPTLRAGTIPAVVYDARGNGDGKTVSTLTGDHESRITDYTSVVVEEAPVYCLQGNGIDRADSAGCNGKGWKKDTSYTLNTVDRPAVAYAMDVGLFTNSKNQSPTLLARTYKDPHIVTWPEGVRYIVRRLTPTECARLQGFPDNWCADLGTENPTDEEMTFWRKAFKTYADVTGAKMKSDKQIAKWLNDPYSDAAEYKMWGNGVALPCVSFVLSGIASVASDGETQEEDIIG